MWTKVSIAAWRRWLWCFEWPFQAAVISFLYLENRPILTWKISLAFWPNHSNQISLQCSNTRGTLCHQSCLWLCEADIAIYCIYIIHHFAGYCIYRIHHIAGFCFYRICTLLAILSIEQHIDCYYVYRIHHIAGLCIYRIYTLLAILSIEQHIDCYYIYSIYNIAGLCIHRI